MTNKSPWRDPPLTNTPLDYVPIDAPVQKITPTRYRVNPLKRGLTAGGWYIAIASLLFIVAVVTGVI